MRAIVLCAGEGIRLRPLTFSRPKHLLPVADKPILGHVLETVSEAGITDVGLVVSPASETLRKYVNGDDAGGLNVSYIEQPSPLGLAHAVDCARDYVEDSPFIVFLGDNLLERDISEFVERFTKGKADASLLLRDRC